VSNSTVSAWHRAVTERLARYLVYLFGHLKIAIVLAVYAECNAAALEQMINEYMMNANTVLSLK